MSPSAESVEVGSARRSDLDAVLSVWEIARSPWATTVDDDAGLERLCRHDRDALIVARTGDHVIGAAIAAWDGWRGHIYRVAVLPEHRLKGIGAALVLEAHARLKARGARRVDVAVAAPDETATAFWTAIGYRRDAAMGRFGFPL
ncbi:MAG TPA: GNAT family N-acetyltransferase [Solirubrobacteraceae bacterium]